MNDERHAQTFTSGGQDPLRPWLLPIMQIVRDINLLEARLDQIVRHLVIDHEPIHRERVETTDG